MKLRALKKMSALFTLLAVMICFQPIAAHSQPNHQSHFNKNKLSRHLKKAYTRVTESNRLWRQQGGGFLPEIIIIGESDPTIQANFLNALNEDVQELAVVMGNFYTQTNPNSREAAFIANLVTQFVFARQLYQRDLIAESEAQFADYANWNNIGIQLAQALANPNPKSDPLVIQNFVGRLVQEQGLAILSLTNGNFSEALNHHVQAVRFGIQIGTHLGRAIVLQEHILNRKTVDAAIIKSFGL